MLIPTIPPMEEHERLLRILGDMCGLPDGVRADRCGQTWCAHHDVETGSCALSLFGVVDAVGLDGLRWLVAHRSSPGAPHTEALAARCASL